MGLHNLPSQSWQINTAWMLAANLATDLDAWLRLLTLHDSKDFADAEPDTMRFRLYHLPALPGLPRPPPLPAHRADLAPGIGVYHQLDEAHLASGHHLTTGPRPDND